jgi:NAD(P)-dependent dehydrogenase (short-subunit alcohol dehydrogenase family)
MGQQNLQGKTVLITGGAVRVGKAMALAVAQAGANVVLHYGSSQGEARKTQKEIQVLGVKADLLQANLSDMEEVQSLVERANEFSPLYALVNNASIFEDLSFSQTNLASWNKNMNINLTAPFLLSQSFAKILGEKEGRIINILDWRALRPGADHFPYTISKAGLAALTRSTAIAVAPKITVNGIAFGAILPPSDGGDTQQIIKDVPAGRWADLEEVAETLLFLLEGPAYITGEIIHLDGGRHLI